jgi:apolipoprotein N-acyltransferase
VGLDWLKNFVFTGFNWSPLAMGLASAPRLMGTADLIGLYGLGLPVAAINGWLAYFRPSRLNTYPLLALAGGVLGLALLYGQFTLSRWEEIDGRGEEKTIAVLQASVEQEMKWDANFRDQILGRYQLLFERAQKENPWLVVWSETAAPFSFGYDPVETDWLTGLLARGHSTALVGVTSLEPEDGVWRLYNRIWLMGPAGAGPFYDKRHLVPFGEYVPMERELPFLRWAFLQGILGAAGRFSPGHAYPPIDYDGTRLGIMICFESIFPYLARGRVREGATLLVVATNDAWFGDSWAPEQHLRQSAWRAVENRRPLVRAANNGISAHISPAGRILTRSPHDGIDAYVYRVRLLPEANREMTFFALYGYLLAPLLAIGTVALFSARLYRSKKIRDVSAKFSEFFRGSRANGPR